MIISVPLRDRYKVVAQKTRQMIEDVRGRRSLHQASKHIKEKHYPDGSFKVVRTSNDELGMDKCYTRVVMNERITEKKIFGALVRDDDNDVMKRIKAAQHFIFPMAGVSVAAFSIGT